MAPYIRFYIIDFIIAYIALSVKIDGTRKRECEGEGTQLSAIAESLLRRNSQYPKKTRSYSE